MGRTCQAVVIFAVVVSATSYGQTNLPATQPTANVATMPQSPTAVGKQTARHRATVVYTDGTVQVTAENSGLNQILREIARQTGMKISGGVADERVYGTYGPAPVAQVLTMLLDGTGSNMIFKAANGGVPGEMAELTLSPRGGGPTPPNPSMSSNEDEPVPPAQTVQPPVTEPAAVVNRPVPLPVSQPVPTPAITSIDQTPQTPPPAGIVSAPTVAPATEPGTTPGPGTQSSGTSDPPPSPNGVKTPEQIYQQLQQLRQQQPQPAQPANPQ